MKIRVASFSGFNARKHNAEACGHMFQKGCENVIICDIQRTIELKLLEQLHTQIKILLQHGVKISKVFSEQNIVILNKK